MGSLIVPDPPCGTPECVETLNKLAAAVEHRDVIGMAKGLVMLAANCSPDEAFATLRTESQHRNMKVWQVAEHWVSDHSRRVASPLSP